MTMWEQYRKTIVPTQLMILTIVGIFIYAGAAPLAVLTIFVVTELCAMVGARWAVRLHRKVADKRDRLPLTP